MDAYARYRSATRKELWETEIPRFNQLQASDRLNEIGLIRAVGVVFAARGSTEEKKTVREWMVHLLTDPEEKVRRYAINAIPKLDAGEKEEEALLSLWEHTTSDREKGYVRLALEKIGGSRTLETLRAHSEHTLPVRVLANIARHAGSGRVTTDHIVSDLRGIRIHLRGRRGLEGFVREELESDSRLRDQFKVVDVKRGLVALQPRQPFCLDDLMVLRCCGVVSLVLGLCRKDPPCSVDLLDAIARAIVSPVARRLWGSFHEGEARYRLEWVGESPPTSSVKRVAQYVAEYWPERLNDSRQAPWAIEIHHTPVGKSVELRLRQTPDPRFDYRVDDVAASSHPPLAASLARWGLDAEGILWDPFCGSGLELIERSRLGGICELHGSDLSEEALAAARANLAAAGLDLNPKIASHWSCCDFRDYPQRAGWSKGSVDLILSNPPLGRRIRIPNLKGLIRDLFDVAAEYLRYGGQLIFTNPVKVVPHDSRLLCLERRVADLGGFDCRLEKWVKGS